MIITLPRSAQRALSEGDLIALTKDSRFIGYGEILTILDSTVMIDVDKRAAKVLNEIFDELIPFSIEIS